MTETFTAERHPVRAALEAGQCDDAAFDGLYTGRVRDVSKHFWTPVAVAGRVSSLLSQLGASRVLDVGAGAGKFCNAAAPMSPQLTFVGVEQRGDLVATARSTTRLLGLANVCHVHANVTEVSWTGFDALYFYNPFGENLNLSDADCVDDAVELSSQRYMSEVAWAEHRLASLAVGTIVVTYHGFGGGVPASFDLIREESCGTDRLRVWMKSASRRLGCWHELHGGGVRRGRLFTFRARA